MTTTTSKEVATGGGLADGMEGNSGNPSAVPGAGGAESAGRDLTAAEKEALLVVCLLAAFADGGKSDGEREEFRRAMTNLGAQQVDGTRLYQDVLLGKRGLPWVKSTLGEPRLRALAYELAVGVCEADDRVNEREKSFLGELKTLLQLEAESTEIVDWRAGALADAALPPPLPGLAGGAGAAGALAATPARTDAYDPLAEGDTTGPAGKANPDASVRPMILGYAVLNGALELLPESLATMAIVPLQMKMVYRVGKAHGYTLDRRSITELLGAAGVGLASQVVEGYARKLLGGLLGKWAGGTARAVGNQVASSAMTFATTLALGHLAHTYYGGGRTLSGGQLRERFQSLLGEAKALHARHADDIRARARSINPAQLVSLVRGR